MNGAPDFRIEPLLQMKGVGGETESRAQPIEITGKLVLEGGAGGGRQTV